MKLQKDHCEIEGCNMNDPSALHFHHIIFKTDGGNNNPANIAIICASHHNLLHAGKLKILGVFPSTNKSGRTLVYEINGKCNVEGITEAYLNASSFKKLKGKKK